MTSPDPEPVPLSTLISRAASGPAATAILESSWESFWPSSPIPPIGDRDLVVWLGDVAAPTALPLALAIVRLDGSPAAVVRAAAVGADVASGALLPRLARAVVEKASARGCTTLVAGRTRTDTETDIDNAGARAMLAISGLTWVGDDVWAIEP
jgi:hypothetical protein